MMNPHTRQIFAWAFIVGLTLTFRFPASGQTPVIPPPTPLLEKVLEIGIHGKVDGARLLTYSSSFLVRIDLAGYKSDTKKPPPVNTQVWLLKSDGSTIQQSRKPYEYGIGNLGWIQPVLVYQFDLTPDTDAIGVAISIDGEIFVEKLDRMQLHPDARPTKERPPPGGELNSLLGGTPSRTNEQRLSFTNDLHVSLEMSLTNFVLSGKPLEVVVKLKNQSVNVILYEAFSEFEEMHLEVLNSKQERPVLTKVGKHLLSVESISHYQLPLRSNTSKVFNPIDLNALYELPPGEYTVKIE